MGMENAFDGNGDGYFHPQMTRIIISTSSTQLFFQKTSRPELPESARKLARICKFVYGVTKTHRILQICCRNNQNMLKSSACVCV